MIKEFALRAIITAIMAAVVLVLLGLLFQAQPNRGDYEEKKRFAQYVR